ncbi:ATP-binding cassette sub-family A member 1 [Chionoecetes opilio]|uniref:ATP-binding cassette sub-family A member 1 n=1 Tax=Chionoecetes opilio TaxID=41210 RepID=A0A8J4XSG4_CHIOP|nr:ATP-binding cassette sub-family A member 1 [Chionoecetes opilio]
MRLKTVLSLTWLDPIIAHMTRAYQSLTALARSGSISDLNKMITGEEDPLTFLAGSVKVIHMEEWNHLAQRWVKNRLFQGLMEDAVPLLTGSQLEEDLQKVVQGVNSVLEARDMGLMDFMSICGINSVLEARDMGLMDFNGEEQDGIASVDNCYKGIWGYLLKGIYFKGIFKSICGINSVLEARDMGLMDFNGEGEDGIASVDNCYKGIWGYLLKGIYFKGIFKSICGINSVLGARDMGLMDFNGEGEDGIASVDNCYKGIWGYLLKGIYFKGIFKSICGINSVLEARDMGLMDFNGEGEDGIASVDNCLKGEYMPITSLVVNWTGLEHYLLTDLSMDPKVVETLAASELNLLALVSVEGTSAEEVLCRGQELGRLVVMPAGTQVTPAQLSAALCSSGDPQALAASFLSQLNLTPLMTLLTRFGVNTSLSSQGVSLGEVAEAVRNVAEASEHMPALVTTLQAFHNLSDVLLAKPRAQRLVANQTAVTIGNITCDPEFLERAGQALCGRPLALLPDTLRLNDMKTKPHSTSNDLDVCERLREDLRSLPGGGLLLHHIQPLLTGKIFFTPDNSITRAIMAQANKTFEAVEQQQQNLRSLSQRAKGITTFTSSEFDLRRLEAALEMPWVQGAIKDLLHAMPSSPSLNLTSLPPLASLTANLKASSPHLLESSRLVREFSDVLEVGVSLMSCLHLHRFIPVHNESQLLEEAHQAVVKREFLAGVVFKDVGESGDTETSLPADVTYTIRVDYSKSPPTFLLGPSIVSKLHGRNDDARKVSGTTRLTHAVGCTRTSGSPRRPHSDITLRAPTSRIRSTTTLRRPREAARTTGRTHARTPSRTPEHTQSRSSSTPGRLTSTHDGRTLRRTTTRTHTKHAATHAAPQHEFWRPGPYSDITFYMRYQQGFIQLQETLENAIVKLQHRQASAGRRRKRSAASPVPLTEAEEDLLLNLPLHTKQQPYPCYTKDE